MSSFSAQLRQDTPHELRTEIEDETARRGNEYNRHYPLLKLDLPGWVDMEEQVTADILNRMRKTSTTAQQVTTH